KPLIAEEKTDDEAVKARYRTATRWVIGFTLPLMVVLTVGASTYLSVVFTPQYVVAAPVVAVLAIGYLVSILGGGPGGSLLQGLGYSRLVFVNTALLFITNVTVSVLLVPRIGILGAGVGTASALSVAGIAALVELYHFRQIHPFTAALGRIGLAAVPAGIAAVGVVVVFDSLLVIGILLPIVVIALYVPALGFARAITSNDVAVAGEINPRFRGVLERIRSIHLPR
ncbi:MAG: polysaccharide biosynthesis C-terminal domain-containing protein, partial [Halobacteriota archaeon]